MKRKLIATLLVLGLMLTFAPITIFSTSAAEWYDGAAENLYVSNEADMKAFAQAIANGKTFSNQTVHIMADIDMGARGVDPSAPSVSGDSLDWPLNRTAGKSFSGMIDGHGHTVQGINVSDGTTPNKGLFGNTLTPIEGFTVGVKNLTIKNSFVRGSNAGGLFGQIAAQAGEVVLDNLDLDIIVYANTTYAGGMFAQSRGYDVTVSNCIFRGSVEAKTNTAGGLFGWQADKNLTIANSVVSGKVTSGGANVGGFIGHTRENGGGNGSDTQILGCVFDGTVTTKIATAFAGGYVGLVGAKNGTAPRPGHLKIQDSAFYGTVHTTIANSPSHIGGFVGATNGGCNSTVTLNRCVVAGHLTAASTPTLQSWNYIRMTIAVVGSGSSATVDNIVGNADGALVSKSGTYISHKCGGSGTVTWGTTFLTGWAGLIPNGYKEAKFYYSNGTGALGLDLSDTFVATTSTKPLPMGTVKFYASQMDAIDANCKTGVHGKQARVEEDGTISVRLIGLAKKDVTTMYEAVGLEVVVLRANGADKVKHVDNADKNANNDKLYTSIYADGVKKETAELNPNFEYIFTGLFTEVRRDGGELVFVARSFHVENGERVYDDTRVMILDPTTVQ